VQIEHAAKKRGAAVDMARPAEQAAFPPRNRGLRVAFPVLVAIMLAPAPAAVSLT